MVDHQPGRYHIPAIQAVNAMMCKALSHKAPSIGDLLDLQVGDGMFASRGDGSRRKPSSSRVEQA